MTLNELYNLVNFIIKVDDRGKSLTPEKFEDLWNRRQIDYFKEIYKRYESDIANSDILRHFKTIIDQNDIIIISSSYFELPTNYFHFSTISYVDSDGKYYPFDMVTKSEALMRKSSTITLPTTTYPICYEFNDTLYLEPYDDSLDIDMVYLRYPTDVVLDYYIDVDGVFQYLEADEYHDWSDGEYDSDGTYRYTGSESVSVSGFDYQSQTVEPEWNEDDKLKILEYILRDVGVSISELEIKEYADIQKNES